jgi:acyl transferase domain-containing protein
MKDEDIAIVGIGCRFPSINSPTQFWELLSRGGCIIADPPASRPAFHSGDAGGYLTEVSSFDPAYFGIPPDQARFIDPQQRLMLDVAAEAIEDAGMPPRRLTGSRTGIFIGISTHDYAVLYWSSARPDAEAPAGTSNSAAANRISHWLGATGPSLAIDTACSSCLTALHLARRSIRSGDIDYAIVGGVSVLLLPQVTSAFRRAGLVSASSNCLPLDRRADGYVRSEGAAAILLKSMSCAHDERDRIYSVIKGSAVNHNGFSNGLTAPNPSAQAAVVVSACRDAGVEPEELQYIEAMGSATLMGDAIELRGVARAMGNNRAQPCTIGSVKANVGHMEAASGMAALIKTSLSLWHGEIPPTPHLTSPNEAFWPGARPAPGDLPIPWPAPSGHRLAGVNSFGFGGANAHVVLAGAPARDGEGHLRIPATQVLLVSAKTEQAFYKLSGDYVAFLRESGEHPVDICFTAAVGRQHYRYRAAVLGDSNQRLADALELAASPIVVPGRPPKIAFSCTGRARAFYVNLSGELKRIYPAFGQDAFEINLAELLITLGIRPAAIFCTGGEGEASALALKRHSLGSIPIVERQDRCGVEYILDLAPFGRLLKIGGGELANDPPNAEDATWPASLWASLYLAGVSVEWDRLYAATNARKVSVPGHPRMNQKFWFEAHQDGPGDSVLMEVERELDALGY